MPTSGIAWQPSLFGLAEAVIVDRRFTGLKRISLDESAWVEHCPGWVSGADALFAELVETVRWGQRSRKMYDREVVEPRLTASWNAHMARPLEPPVLAEMRDLLSERYGVDFATVGFNFYRDGKDSVAWHGDRIPKHVVDPLVALVSVGEPRKFLLRPSAGGRSKSFNLGRGDLLVTGGTCQRTWQHSVPKVAHAGPRISLAFRHDMGRKGYDDSDPGDGVASPELSDEVSS